MALRTTAMTTRGLPSVAITMRSMTVHEATKTATLSGPVMGHKSVVACSKETGQRRRSILVRALNHRTQKPPIYKYFTCTLAPNYLVAGGTRDRPARGLDEGNMDDGAWACPAVLRAFLNRRAGAYRQHLWLPCNRFRTFKPYPPVAPMAPRFGHTIQRHRGPLRLGKPYMMRAGGRPALFAGGGGKRLWKPRPI